MLVGGCDDLRSRDRVRVVGAVDFGREGDGGGGAGREREEDDGGEGDWVHGEGAKEDALRC